MRVEDWPTVRGLPRRRGAREFAEDSYRRLIVQDLDEMVRRATQFMRKIPGDDRGSHTLEHIPYRLLTQFNIG